jgi:PTS system cellobiose-specific IIA component
MNIEEVAMQIILHAGNARALAFEALEKARQNKFKLAKAKLKEAEKELETAHDFQTSLLQKEAQGVLQEASLLLSHALDHVMSASTEKGLIEELLEVYKRLRG